MSRISFGLCEVMPTGGTLLNVNNFFAPVLFSKVLRPFLARGLLSGKETVVAKN